VAPRIKKAPKPAALFTRNEVIGLCKRFLKEDDSVNKYYDPVNSVVTMYQLIKRYPNREFWLAYELGFQLRSLYWLLGKDGKERLDRDWSIAQLDLGPQVEQIVGTEKVGEDVVVEKPKVSVADFLR
jgi:hypothetical protein